MPGHSGCAGQGCYPRRPKRRESAIRRDIGVSRSGAARGSLARGDDLQVAEVVQTLGTKLRAKTRGLVAG